MYYNKLYGLEHLRKALHGTAGVSVLPWRVYRTPEEFQPEHFPKARRLLLRTNLDGSMNRMVWSNLPRGEANPEKARKAMAALSRLWMDKTLSESSAFLLSREATKPNSFHFIAHGVEPRENYPIACIAERQPGNLGWFFEVKKLYRTERLWRTPTPSEYSYRATDLETLKSTLHQLKTNLNKRQVNTLAQRIVRACTAIETHLKKQGVDLNKTVVETSLAVNKREPTTPEFYDLLLKTGTFLGLTPAGGTAEIDADPIDLK